MAEDEVVDESATGRLREELQGFIKRTDEQISNFDCVAMKLQDQASSIKDRHEFLSSKLPRIEAEISRINAEISKNTAEIKKNAAEISKNTAEIKKNAAEISKINDEIGPMKTEQISLRSTVDSLKSKKAVEQIEGCIDKMNETLVKVRGVVERIDDMLNSLLSFSVQMSFGYNFFSFIVQYHSTCGNWHMVFGMIAAFLTFLGFPLWINWRMLENNFVTLEFHSRIVEKLRSKAQNILQDNNLQSGDVGLPSRPQINEIRRKYVKKFVGIVMFVVIQCIVVSVGSHFLFCGKSLSFGPLLSASVHERGKVCTRGFHSQTEINMVGIDFQ